MTIFIVKSSTDAQGKHTYAYGIEGQPTKSFVSASEIAFVLAELSQKHGADLKVISIG